MGAIIGPMNQFLPPRIARVGYLIKFRYPNGQWCLPPLRGRRRLTLRTVVREQEYRVRVCGMRSIDSIAEDYVERAAALNPALATYAGIAGHDGELPDLSADGFAERAGLDRATLAALGAAEAPGLREQTARAAMQERLALAVERYDAGDTASDLNVIDSWVQYVREVFDLMPTEDAEAAATVAK